MKMNKTKPSLSTQDYLSIRVALHLRIGQQWQSRRDTQKYFTMGYANAAYNQDIRQTISAYKQVEKVFNNA